MDIWDVEQQTVEQKNKLGLSDIQKKLITEAWNSGTHAIVDFFNIAYPNEEFDGRSKKVVLIKQFLVDSKLNDNKTLPLQPVKKGFELSLAHKEYIRNNYSNTRTMEMARTLFGNSMSAGSVEVKEMSIYIKELGSLSLDAEEDEVKEYSPPKSIERVLTRLKKYLEEVKDWDIKKLTPGQRKGCASLINYLSSYRFASQIDSLETKKEKELFESSFIKYTYDKNDLSQENCDQYILLCSLIIREKQIEKNTKLLQKEQDRFLEEEGKISMAVVEAIKTAETSADACVKMQQALYKSLTQERSDKLSEEIKDKASLLNLVNAWKNFDTRQRMLQLAQKQKENTRKDLKEMENLSEMKLRILGLSIDEILNG